MGRRIVRTGPVPPVPRAGGLRRHAISGGSAERWRWPCSTGRRSGSAACSWSSSLVVVRGWRRRRLGPDEWRLAGVSAASLVLLVLPEHDPIRATARTSDGAPGAQPGRRATHEDARLRRRRLRRSPLPADQPAHLPAPGWSLTDHPVPVPRRPSPTPPRVRQRRLRHHVSNTEPARLDTAAVRTGRARRGARPHGCPEPSCRTMVAARRRRWRARCSHADDLGVPRTSLPGRFRRDAPPAEPARSRRRDPRRRGPRRQHPTMARRRRSRRDRLVGRRERRHGAVVVISHRPRRWRRGARRAAGQGRLLVERWHRPSRQRRRLLVRACRPAPGRTDRGARPVCRRLVSPPANPSIRG